MIPRIVAVVPFIVTVTATNGQFTGDYAPDTWTVIGAGIGGSSAEFAPDGSSLTITGSDGGFGNDIDVTHIVLAGGIWIFNWSYASDNYRGFDNAFYLLNDTPYFLTGTSGARRNEGLIVQTGDVIGWRVESIDGIWGPGVLTISYIQIPAAGILPLLGFIGLLQTRRRR